MYPVIQKTRIAGCREAGSSQNLIEWQRLWPRAYKHSEVEANCGPRGQSFGYALGHERSWRAPQMTVRLRPPERVRSDNGPEFGARNVRGWLDRIGVKTLFIEPGSPWGTVAA